MYKILYVLFVIKLYARINIFKRLKKHGENNYKLSKTIENQFSKHWKIQLDISFMKQCKKEHTIPSFVKVNVAVRHSSDKLQEKIAYPVMLTELQNKYHERLKSKNDTIKTTSKLKSSISFAKYYRLLHQKNVEGKSKCRALTLKKRFTVIMNFRK